MKLYIQTEVWNTHLKYIVLKTRHTRDVEDTSTHEPIHIIDAMRNFIQVMLIINSSL